MFWVTFVVLFLCVVSFAIYRSIAQPLSRISKNMEDLAEEKDTQIQDGDRGDEIGEMARRLVYLEKKLTQGRLLERQQKELKDEAEKQQKEAMKALAVDFDNQVGGIIKTLGQSAITLRSTAENLTDVADKTAQSSQCVFVSSSEASSNVNSVASAVEEMNSTSTEIAKQISNTRTRSNDTAQNANKANKTVEDLRELVSNIGEVVGAIRDIAEQTNLLALNATIEAARAGEAGKGFAVVAEEVKKLATETGQKTDEIEEKMNHIQSATEASVVAMKRIIENISQIDETITSVSAAVEEQNVTNGEIARSISEASQSVQVVSSRIGDVQKGTNETEDSASDVLCAARELASLSEELKVSVDEFLNQIKSGSEGDMSGNVETLLVAAE